MEDAELGATRAEEEALSRSTGGAEARALWAGRRGAYKEQQMDAKTGDAGGGPKAGAGEPQPVHNPVKNEGREVLYIWGSPPASLAPH